MSAAPAALGPGSRVLLGWWRELLGRHPQQLWFSRLLLHCIEASFRITRTQPLDSWQRALLRLFSTRAPCAGSLEDHLADLHVDRQVLAQLVRQLTEAGLLYRNGTDRWDLSSTGRHVLETGSLAVPSEERRTLYFVDNSPLHGHPSFLPLRRTPPLPTGPVPETASLRFDVSCLETCIQQSPQWKRRYHFPAELEAFLPSRSDAPAASWQRVVLDSLVPLAIVLIRTAEAGKPVVLGFAVRTEGWTLEPEPVLSLEEGWEEPLPDLAAEPAPESWWQAWQAWCQPRSLPRAEVEACRLERAGHRLLVHAPPPLIDRLRVARSDAIKHEAWLLAGEGRTRPAAQIDLQPLDVR